MKMNILITSIMDVKKTAPNRLHHFVKHLARNHNVTVLSTNQWWKAEQVNVNSYGKDLEDMLQNVEVKYVTERKLSPILQEMLPIINQNQLFNDIDLSSFTVHLNYSTLILGYIVTGKLKSIGTGSVYDLADDLPQMVRISPEIPSLLRAPSKLVSEIIVRKNIEIANKVTFTCDSLRNSSFVPRNKSVVIPNGVNTGLFKPYPSRHLQAKLGLNQNFVIGYVGSLREWVDLETVFAAVKPLTDSCPDIRILIVGEEGKFKECKDLSKEYGLSDYVVFTGTVPYTQVPGYISCMDICLIPFKTNSVAQNALPLKLFEYMACEKPVISTKLRGVMEAVQNRAVYASNREELRSQIMELYNNEGLRRRLSFEGRNFVEENYSWPKICSNLEEVLLEVASTKGKE
ncbi:glycosyltransferase family 4 protein [Chloroflexota bacterium]